MGGVDIFADSTGYLLHRLGIGADRVIQEALRPHDIRSRHLRVLALLGPHSRSQAELVELSGLDRTTMVGVIDHLEERGLVRRRRDDSDRRRFAVSVTSKGAKLLDAASSDLQAVETDFLEPLSMTQRRELNELLRVLFAVHAPRC